MIVVVTGGLGFIGSHVVENLLMRDFKVRIIDRRLDSNLFIDKNNVELIRGDIRNPDFTYEAIKGADYVIHMAALINVDQSIDAPRAFWDNNVYGTFNLIESIRREPKIKKIIYMSTCEIYGNIVKNKANEKFPDPVPRSPYAASKFAAERYCMAYYLTFGKPEIVIIRGFNTFGPRQRSGARGAVIPIFINRVLQRKPPLIFGDGKQTRDFVYVVDMAEGIVRALEKDGIGGEVINLATGKEHTIQEVATKIIKYCDIDDVVPKFVAPRPGELRRSVGDWSKAKKLLNWNPKHSFDEGLMNTIEYIKKIYTDNLNHRDEFIN
ncbi:MAG: GDP-mannose 4,6-dehydratase [Candidatus Hodarchaeota archaeon]